jgi:hypothetical protein
MKNPKLLAILLSLCAFFVLSIVGCAQSAPATNNNAATVSKTENWTNIINGGPGYGQWSLSLMSDSSIKVSGFAANNGTGCTFINGNVTLSGTNIFFTANGNATNSFGASSLVFTGVGFISNGHGLGIYTNIFSTTGWGTDTGVWEAFLTSGDGVTP